MAEYIYECLECGEIVTSDRELKPDERKCPYCGGELELVGTWSSE